ncbi:MAG: gliding motility-associated C-terminal domain-containing protein [Bacteroidota bacterium]
MKISPNSLKKAALLIGFIFGTGTAAFAQTNLTLVLQYSGAQSLGCCNICGSDYICFGGACGCCFPNGNQTFTDPIPAGNTIIGVSVTYFSGDCGATQVPTSINTTFIGNAPVSGGNCLCGSCWVHTTNNTYNCVGLPGYNYGGSNTLFPTPNGIICCDRVEITFTYVPTSSFNLPPIGTVSGTNNACSGTTGMFTVGAVQGASNYSWVVPSGSTITSGQGNDTIQVLFGSTSGQVCVYAMSACDTVGPACYNVTLNQQPVAAVNPSAPSVCSGGSIVLTASGGSNYSWSPSTGLSSITSSNPTASPTATTTYTVAVSNGICLDTQAVTVTVNNLPVVSAGLDTSICNGFSTTLNASGGTSYVWSPATGLSSSTVSNPTASPTTTITYTVTGTGSNGCTASDQVTVTVNNATATANPASVSVCNGDSVQISVTGNGVSWSWSPATDLSSTSIQSPYASPAAPTTYTVVVTDANGCTASTTVQVSLNALPNASAGPDVTICLGGNTTLSATGGTSYSWSPATGLSNTGISNPVAAPTATTSYVVTVSNGTCSNTDTVVVSVSPLPTANAGPDQTLCQGSTTPVQLNATGGTSYSWSPSFGLSATNIANPTAQPGTTTTYTVTVTNAAGCTATDIITITVSSPPVANAGPDVTLCIGGSTQLSASGGSTYQWSPATGLSNTSSANPTANPTATTTYTVTVTNAAGCTDTDVITVNVTPGYPLDTPASTDQTCGNLDGTATAGNPLGGTPPYTYSWATTPVQTTQTATGLAQGTYTVFVTDAQGCLVQQTVTVNQVLGIVAGFTATPSVGIAPQLVTFTNTSTGGTTFSWNFGDGNTSTAQNPSNTYNSPGTYTVMLIAYNTPSCSDTAYVTVIIEEKVTVIAPNIFTPNGDGSNDVFSLTLQGAKSAQVIIFNRWGAEIASFDPLTGNWDGKANSGSMVDDGTYYFTISILGFDDKTYTEKGFVQVSKK